MTPIARNRESSVVQDAVARSNEGNDEGGDAAPLRCYRWPNKRLFRTAEEAGVALREIFWERYERGDEEPVVLRPYPCDGADVDHWHHGGPLRTGTALHPSERGPERATRGPRRRPRGRSSPGRARRS